ncbi:hypothetical protein Tco_1089954 [Tanacetum coccineum]|uniref:Uncharacterized protein n=1 Tax=Tanacetum coccineum TaxID=301880 RepID=A0ABQ5I3Z0_9ASTR
MCTYLKNMAGFTHNQLKNKSFDEVQKAFDKTMGWIDSFVPMDSEVVKDRAEGSETRAEGSSKRAGEDLQQESTKKQKVDDDDKEKEDLKQCFELVLEEEVAINAIPLATKPTHIRLVKAKHGNTRPEEAYERVLWGDLKVMFEPDVESEVWRNLQGYKVTVWKLFDSFTIWDKEVTILILLGLWVTTAWDAWDERSTAAFKILVLLDATVKEYTD